MKFIALLAHDAMKPQLVELVRTWRAFLARHALVSTEDTGLLLQDTLALNLQHTPPGTQGGELHIGALVANDDIRAVIFLRDALTSRPEYPEFGPILRVCDIHNVPLATNVATAHLLLRAFAREAAEALPELN